MSSRFSRSPNDCKVYIGSLERDASEKEVERAFSYYGPLKSVWVARNPPGFAFVEFEDYRDAEDSVKEMDGSTICGSRIRVELSTGKTRVKPWQRGGGRSRGPSRNGRRVFNPDDRCYECGDRGHYAYDCPRSRRGGGSSSRRRRSRSHSRSYSRSRSRGRRDSRSKSRSRSPYHSRSRSPPPKSRSRSGSRHSN